MSENKSAFILPPIHDSEHGWGPANVIPSQFRDIPYAPYSKGDKLGRVADWTNPDGQKQDNRENTGRQGRTGFNRFNRDQHQSYGASFASAFAYTHTEDESSFSVVDNRSATVKKMALKAAGGNTRARPQNKQQQQLQQQQQQQQQGYRTVASRPTGGKQQTQQARKRYGHRDYDKPQRVRNASVNIGADWNLLDEIEFSRLSKLTFGIPEAEDIATFGSINYYNKSYDRVNTRNEKALQHIDRVKYDTTTSEDPVIQQFINEDKATVYATDAVLSLLMCATRTVYPWDIVVKKENDKVILDKRPGGVFDFVTVNENTMDPPAENDKDTINSWSALCNEATYINQNFARQVLEPSTAVTFDKANPFATADTTNKLASCGYRYRQFNLASTNQDESVEPINMIVRTEVDAAVKTGNKNTLVTIRALNEFDPNAQGAGGALSWKKSLDSQRGAVVATEMRNNAAKLARWAVQALLAGAEQLKLGYIARATPKDNSRHVILGTQAYKPRDFAAQMNLSLTNGWGIVKAVVDMCLQLPDGRYVMMKDPNRPILRIYAVPGEDDLDAEYDDEEGTEQDDTTIDN
ncbi:eukaryotic translation initiation factor 3 subunit D [Halteromyces radiatus]|uniref:eukaryotic translation initiation factor 3 subunit D n=1 Tax=Halteromyces radiatus TaxID=101107 RepID=UPI00222046BB|nr:eukaryotic translation initiation factor 3 subunit D [Halteromyces radiatus]KAI8093564.1 eukaryotic translation initiation factor 3 subunit D [Halteromyces radiatus]